MEIYKPQELKKPGLLQKMIGKAPSENGWIEINNLFATYQTEIEKISLDNIIEVADKYKINLKKEFKTQRLELFQTYLHHCLIDSKLEDSEIIALKHLKEILLLNENDIQELLKTETEKLYNVHVKEAVSDGRLDDFEKENLEKLKKDLLISDEIADKIYETSAQEILHNFIDGAVSDERLSPEELLEIIAIAQSLGIYLELDDNSKKNCYLNTSYIGKLKMENYQRLMRTLIFRKQRTFILRLT